jgi:hypothetical protein
VADDSHGKILWDVVTARLAAQAANQAAMCGRAKDLISTATVATAITGIILNDKVFNVSKGDMPLWWLVGAGISLLVIFVAGLWALQPANYSFAPDAGDFYLNVQKHPTASDDQFYRSLAEGYLIASNGQTQIERNQKGLQRLARLVRIETIGIAALVVLAFILAFVFKSAGIS